jgi:hypothetical protein
MRLCGRNGQKKPECVSPLEKGTDANGRKKAKNQKYVAPLEMP